MKIACEELHKIYSIMIDIRNEIKENSNSDNKQKNDIILMINRMIEGKKEVEDLIEMKSCFTFMVDFLSCLIDTEKPLPLSDTYGNYLSSLIRYNLRKELNPCVLMTDEVIHSFYE